MALKTSCFHFRFIHSILMSSPSSVPMWTKWKLSGTSFSSLAIDSILVGSSSLIWRRVEAYGSLVWAFSVASSAKFSESWASMMASLPSAPFKLTLAAVLAAVATNPGTGGTGGNATPAPCQATGSSSWRRVEAYGSLVWAFSVASSANFSDSWASMMAALPSAPFLSTLPAVAAAVATNPGTGGTGGNATPAPCQATGSSVWSRVEAYGSLVWAFSVASSANFSDSWASIIASFPSAPFLLTFPAVAAAVATNPGTGGTGGKATPAPYQATGSSSWT